MIKIDQDTLCEYCTDYHNTNMEGCEGTECKKMTEMYLEEFGITEDDPEKKTFGNLRVGDVIYLLVSEPAIPEIKICRINSLEQMNNNPLRIHYDSTGVNIPTEKVDSDNSQSFYLYRKDCEQALEELCTERIINLSKAIGSNNA